MARQEMTPAWLTCSSHQFFCHVFNTSQIDFATTTKKRYRNKF